MPGLHAIASSGSLDHGLDEMFAALPKETQATILPILDSHGDYLSKMGTLTLNRLQNVLDQVNGNNRDGDHVDAAKFGPGLYLARWQSLLNQTLITPETAHGPVRRGRDVKGVTLQGKLRKMSGGPVDGSKDSNSQVVMEGSPALTQFDLERIQATEPPDPTSVLEALGSQFRTLLATSTRAPQIQ